MNDLLAGIDIGGTKCAVSLGQMDTDQVTILEKRRFSTPSTPQAALDELIEALESLLAGQDRSLRAIGISCGGPLDSKRGLILSPPNLLGWDTIPVVETFHKHFGVATALQNDANAGALAEWLWGAGKGCQNVIFLTFGTGMGAGLILNGQLYSGTNDLAGEVGHARLAEDGPVGYGKAGSFEGFCSGGGIQRLAVAKARLALDAGHPPSFCPTEADLSQITAERVAQSSDPLADEIFDIVAQRLGQGLALLIDILNPERIIIGSIYLRQQARLEATMRAVLEREALSRAVDVCEILPAGLGESVGDYAALAVACYQS
ncbi:MAG: ROK family protein [Anaerolineae bacterium]|nr:ROK family protein [Anaerolineae bacterium]